MSATSHFLQTWLQFFLWTTVYDDQQQISHPCECWNWEKVDKKFNSVPLNWLRNRILCGSLKSLLWIGYNQNLKRSGWENSFLVGHLSNMTPVRFSAEKKINNGNTKSTISTNSTAHSPHTHIGRYIMHCLPCVFGHFQFISSQRALRLMLWRLEWCDQSPKNLGGRVALPSGKFLRVTLKIALRSFRTLWKISR